MLHDTAPRQVENLQNSRGQPLSTVKGVALCRCGASNNKPFCDGSHSLINFSSDNANDSQELPVHMKSKKSYVGNNITIHDNRKVCSHAAHCVEGLSTVFKLDSRPWINVNGATKEEIIETVCKCPSGALSYSINEMEYKDVGNREPLIIVSKNGPYLVSGGVELLGEAQMDPLSSKEHYSLCRCGASNNKPFCDGSHKSINFESE